jgi:hypothetical protein
VTTAVTPPSVSPLIGCPGCRRHELCRAVDRPRRRVSTVEERASRLSLGSGQARAGPGRRLSWGRLPGRVFGD